MMTFRAWISEELRINRAAMEASSRLGPNSYGHGYDTGWVYASAAWAAEVLLGITPTR